MLGRLGGLSSKLVHDEDEDEDEEEEEESALINF